MDSEHLELQVKYAKNRLKAEHRHYAGVIVAAIVLSLFAMLGDFRHGAAAAVFLLGMPYVLSLVEFDIVSIPEIELRIIEKDILKKVLHIYAFYVNLVGAGTAMALANWGELESW